MMPYCNEIIPLGSDCPPTSQSYQPEDHNLCIGSPEVSCIMKTCQDGQLDVGSTCLADRDCKRMSCGHNDWNISSTKKVCCDSDEIAKVPKNYTRAERSNFMDMCPNSIPEGGQCPFWYTDTPSLCSNGSMCIAGVCQRDLAPAGSPCWTDSQCLNGQCGLTRFSSWSDMEATAQPGVCCPSGGKSQVANYMYCDRSIPNGHLCPPSRHNGDGERGSSDSFCESNMCVRGICSQERLVSGVECFRNEDCTNQACGRLERSEYDYDKNIRAKSVCCPNGALGAKSKEVCSGIIPTGQPCYYDEDPSLCVGGFCVEGKCADELRRSNEPCLQDDDCVDVSCGFNRWDFHDRRKVCCLSQATLKDADGYAICTANIPRGEMCFDDSVCLEGLACGPGGICE